MDGELKTMACCRGVYIKKIVLRKERERDVHDASYTAVCCTRR